MRSIFLALAFGAVAHAAEDCDADEATMLQGGIRGRKVKQHTDANSVLKSLQDLSSSMTKEGFKNKLSKDTVDDALASANTALQALTPTIQASVTQAQTQIDDAASAVMFCHSASGVEQRAVLSAQVATFQAELATCQSELEGLTTAATNQCNIAQDCLCDEANERRDGKAEVCASKTVTYEVAWCESNVVCVAHGECHANEMGVYTLLRVDVEAEIGTIQQEYIATQQSTCLMGLIMTAMATGTPIDVSAQAQCLTVDASGIAITYPTLPGTPEACPPAAIGNPSCAGSVAYNYGQNRGGNGCSGDDVSEENCLAAVQALLASGQTQGRTSLVAGSWGWVPPGCSSQNGGDFAAHYNRGNGNNDGGYTQVCNQPCQHLTNQDVVAGTFEHYGRDYSNSPSDEECSATCTADPECTAWVRQPSTGNCWISRQAKPTFEADSDRTTGLRCN